MDQRAWWVTIHEAAKESDRTERLNNNSNTRDREMVERITAIRKHQGVPFSRQSVSGNILQKVLWYFYLQSLNILLKLEEKGNLSILYSFNQIFMFCFDFNVIWCVETSGTRILMWLCQKAVSLCRSLLRKEEPSTSPVPSLIPSDLTCLCPLWEPSPFPICVVVADVRIWSSCLNSTLRGNKPLFHSSSHSPCFPATVSCFEEILLKHVDGKGAYVSIFPITHFQLMPSLLKPVQWCAHADIWDLQHIPLFIPGVIPDQNEDEEHLTKLLIL